jgi:hypothetical protein
MVALKELSAQWSILTIVWLVRVMRAGRVSHAGIPRVSIGGCGAPRSIAEIALAEMSLACGFKMPFEGNGHRSGCGLGVVKMLPDGFGGLSWNYGSQRFGGGLLHVAEAAEVSEQALTGLRAYAGDRQ